MAQHIKEENPLLQPNPLYQEVGELPPLPSCDEDEGKWSFSNKIVAICIIMNVIFTVAIFAIKMYNYYIVIPDSLIVAWFGFWGAELVSLASIKKDKIKNKYHM